MWNPKKCHPFLSDDRVKGHRETESHEVEAEDDRCVTLNEGEIEVDFLAEADDRFDTPTEAGSIEVAGKADDRVDALSEAELDVVDCFDVADNLGA